MAKVSEILTDINLRYRHSFSNTQVLVWLNEEMRELYDIMEQDSLPFTFQTMWQEDFYSFPADYDITKIKVVTYQRPDGHFIELPFVRNDDMQGADPSSHWYAILSNMMYLNVPGGNVDDRMVLIYCDSDPDVVTEADLDKEIALPRKYQEILKLGVLKRVCQARKDIPMSNSYDADREQKVQDLLWQKRMNEPEWSTTIDVLPRVGW